MYNHTDVPQVTESLISLTYKLMFLRNICQIVLPAH